MPGAYAMNNPSTTLTFYGRGKGMKMAPALLAQLGDPEYIGFSFNRDIKTLCLLPSTSRDRDAIKVSENFSGQMFYRTRFNGLIYDIAGWNTNLTYRVQGRYEASLNVFLFDLKQCDIMWKGKKIFTLVK